VNDLVKNKNIHIGTNQYSGNDDDMDRGTIKDMTNSDNAFSDKGLDNARLTNEAMNKSNK
jgi:hypothetical protein